MSQTAQPLVAFLRNGDGAEAFFEVYLINTTQTPFKRVCVLTGAFCSMDGGLMETMKVVKELGTLPPNSTVLIDSSDWYELDYVIWYCVDLYPEDGDSPVMFGCQLPKYGSGYEADAELIPALGKVGLLLEAEGRSSPTTIDEDVKTLDLNPRFTKDRS